MWHKSKLKNNCDLAHVSGSFNHETISKIRNSQSDAEARRIIATHIKKLPLTYGCMASCGKL